MKKYILLCLFLSCSVMLLSQTKLPAVKLINLKGQAVDSRSVLSDSLPVVISFWSTICKPCIEELNAFTDQWESWQKEVRFQLLAVSVDDVRTVAKVPAFVAAHEWPFIVWLDKNQEFKRALNVNAVPHLYILSSEGSVVYSRIGYTPGGESEVLEVLKNLP